MMVPQPVMSIILLFPSSQKTVRNEFSSHIPLANIFLLIHSES